MSQSGKEKALKIVQEASRIKFTELRYNPGAVTKGKVVTKHHNRSGQGMKELQGSSKPPLGWIWGDFISPWQRKFPSDPSFNKDPHLKREYPPISLIELQRLIDLGWIRANEKLIDLTQLCNTFLYKLTPMKQQFGVQLQDEGADDFDAVVNIEVQYATELAIAAIERLGGTIFTAYYDTRALQALVAPQTHFENGRPIPRRMAPPSDLIEYYSNPKARGYLAPLADIRQARFELSQKYGYKFTDINLEHLKYKKDRNDVFYGLKAGDVVSLKDKCVIRPVDDEARSFYGLKNIKET